MRRALDGLAYLVLGLLWLTVAGAVLTILLLPAWRAIVEDDYLLAFSVYGGLAGGVAVIWAAKRLGSW